MEVSTLKTPSGTAEASRAPGTAEFDVLVRCAKSRMTDEDAARVREAAAAGLDWDRLLQCADFHGVQPLLYNNLLSVARDFLGDRESAMKQRMAGTTAYVLFLARELSRIAETLKNAGINAVPFKGPVLAKTAYGAIQHRLYTDLDLLIHKADFEEVERRLLADGYKIYSRLAEYSELQKKRYIARTQQYPFIHADDVFSVDVHVGIMPPLYYFPIETEVLMDRSVEVDILGTKLRSFEPEDMLLILCYHGEKNRWERLKNICDVAELVRATPSLDWDRFMERVALTRSERLVNLGLCLANRLFGTQVPPEMTRRFEQDHLAQGLGQLVLEELPHQHEIGTISFAKRMRFHLTLQRTATTKARYLFHALVRRIRTDD